MGLVQYDSSDEDEDEQMQIEAQPEVRILSLLFWTSSKTRQIANTTLYLASDTEASRYCLQSDR